MKWRFRKRIKIVPGLWLNLSKGAPSLSMGGHGATINVSKRGIKGTAGLPGSGLSVSETVPWHKASGGKSGRAPEAKSGDSGPVSSPAAPEPEAWRKMNFFQPFSHFACIAGLDEQIATAEREGNTAQAANIRQEREKLYTRFPETAPAKDPDFLGLLGREVRI